MAIRYATKAVMLDGKSYNAGDIIPGNLGDRAGAEKWSRLEGEAIPTPEVPKVGVTSESLDTETVDSTEETKEEEETVETTDTEESKEDGETETAEVTPEEETPARGRRSRK